MDIIIQKYVKNEKKTHYRYNFPVPPMRTPRIIEPLILEDNVVIDKSKYLFAFLEQRDFYELMSFDDFLTELNLTKDEYIQAIQCMLKKPTIFLKRKHSHIWKNNFSKDFPVMWNENIDVQYVLNAYATTSHCTSYMTKVDKSMTSAFRRIHKEHEISHIDVMQMIHTLENTLLNLQKMSSQQAIHIALSPPLNCSSRKCVFINTSPLDKHTFMLKPLSLLEQEPRNSEDVLCLSIIDYYL
jgi:hypothetical protein